KGPGEAYEAGARVLEAMRNPIIVDGNILSLNASLGIVVSAGDDDADALIRNADVAMYKAKAGGKGRYEIFEWGMHQSVLARLELKADLRRAVDYGEFVAHYQPLVDLASGGLNGAQALVCWVPPP